MIRDSSLFFLRALGILLFTAAVCAAELLICSKCGYENPQGSLFCAHCGSPFGAASAAVTSAPPPEAAVTPPGLRGGAVVEPALIDQELQRASGYLQHDEAWLALLFTENALALNLLCRTNSLLAQGLNLAHEAAERKIRMTVGACPACNGTGKTGQRQPQDSGGALGVRVLPSICAHCNGTGLQPAPRSLERVHQDYGRAIKQYTTLRQAERWVPLGRTWIPHELDGRVTPPQIAALKRVTASRCPDCLGMGQVSCEKCSGTGQIRCTNRGCVDGYVVKKAAMGFSGSSGRTLKVQCDVCKGHGFISCPACFGSGGISCSTCKGTGKLPLCRSCDGEGLRSCSRCNGTGTDRHGDPCASCGGTGGVLCPSCKGNGTRDRS